MDKITILITDDHKLIREIWGFLINSEPRFHVVAECSTAEEAIEFSKRLKPDIVIMDINLPGMSGIEATQQILLDTPDSKVLGVSLHNEPAYARKMLQLGAMGYVTKNSSKEEMLKAILEIHNGRKYICGEIKNILSEQVMRGDDPTSGIRTLTERELEIIGLIQKGSSSKDIAANLYISVKTVEVHRYNILKKLKLKNAAALVNFMNHHPGG